MKMIAILKKRMISVILAVVLLISVSVLDFGSVSAENKTFHFTNGSGTCVEENGIFNLIFQSSWSMAVSDFQIDLLKGFQFRYTTFAKSHFYLADDTDAYIELTLWKESNGVLHFEDGRGHQIVFTAEENKAHYLKFVPVKASGTEKITGYELRLDDRSLDGGGIVWTPDVFCKCNAYNTGKEIFDGAYLWVTNEGAAPELSINVGMKFFERSPNTAYRAVACTLNDYDSFDLKFSTWSMAVADFRIDLLQGFRFKYTTFGKTEFYFSNEKNSDDVWSLKTWQDTNGDLLCDIGTGGYQTKLGAADAVTQTYWLKFVPVMTGETVTGYELRINDKPLGGGVILSVEQFRKYNGYRVEQGNFEGTYLRLFDNDVAPELRISLINRNAPEPTAKDNEIIFLEDGGVGNVIYKMNPAKAVDLSSLMISCNVHDVNNDRTPSMSLATSLDSTDWLTLDVDQTDADGWRYYTYSGDEQFLPAGNIYIKLGASGSGKSDFIAQASYTYGEYREVKDGEITFLYQRGVGNTVYKMDSAKNIDLTAFQFICNVNENNHGRTPQKVYVSKSLNHDADWYELDCTYSDALTSNDGWRHYTYSGENVTLLAGNVYLKLGTSDQMSADLIAKGYYLYGNQTTGDINGDENIDIRDLVRAKKNFALKPGEYYDAFDMDHNGNTDVNDLTLFRKLILEYDMNSRNKTKLKNTLYGDGIHDDYPAIQEMLDRGESLVRLPDTNCYWISQTIKMHSNQTLRLSKNTRVKLLPGSNCCLIENEDFSTLAENITVEGGIWDMNHSKQDPNPYHFAGSDGKTFYEYVDEIGWKKETATKFLEGRYTGMAMRFCQVKNLAVKDLTINNPVVYGMQIAYIDGFTIENIFCDYTEGSPKKWNMDGVHVEGYCKNGLISNIYGTTHDDAVAITADDSLWGPIKNIKVDGVHMTNSHSGVRLLSHGAFPVEDIEIKNVTGSYYHYCIGLTKYYYDVRNGIMKNITIDGVDACVCPGTEDVASCTAPFIWVQAGLEIDGLEISNVRRNQTTEEPRSKNVSMLTIENSIVKNMKLNNILQISHFNELIPQLSISDTVDIIEQNNIVNRLAQPGD